ncbi:MAG: response regulator, partial [Myxococcota bacterium]
DLQRLIAKSLGSEVRLSVDLGNGLSPVHFDRSDLEQAIMHVAIQCRDRMPNGGQVLLRCWQTGRHVGVEVQDDGRGLEPEETEAIYADESAPEDLQSVVALRAVRRILEQGGAVLEIESKARAGTRYRLVFDAVAELEETKGNSDDHTGALEGGGRSVVILDFDDAVVRSVRRILDARGFVVHSADTFGDLQAGLRAQQWGEPVCVLLDDASLGAEKLDGLRRAHPHIARIIIRGGSREHNEPFAVVLDKPFDERALIDAVVSAEQVSRRAPPPGTARVLIVDDDALTARSITRVLDGLCEPEHVFGERAELLQRLENDDYDLVLCDVLMPGINGMQLFEWVRARSPAIAQRFVFLTAAAEFDIIREFADSIPNPVYSKPMDRKGFETLLSERGLL